MLIEPCEEQIWCVVLVCLWWCLMNYRSVLIKSKLMDVPKRNIILIKYLNQVYIAVFTPIKAENTP